MRPIRIFLADLIHNQHFTYYTVPLNIAAIAVRLQARLGNAVEVELFKFPDKLLEAIDKKPDILAVSNYDWNFNLSKKLAEVFRQSNPSTLTVMGGPNIRRDPLGVKQFLLENREIDVYTLHEGEDAFSDLVETILGNWPCNPRELLQRNTPKIAQNAYLVDDGADLMVGDLCDTAKTNPMPYQSAWLSGILDPFMDQEDYPLFPSIETNRGCPYACHFCVWGAYEKNKVRKYEIDTVVAELDYIFRRAKKNSYLFLCDANFGILNRDIELAQEIRRLADTYQTISHVELFSDKTRIENNEEVLRILGNLTVACFATQTFNEEALKNSGRDNVSEERMTQFVDHVKSDGRGVYTDLLVGIPGDTIDTHTANLKKVYDIGFQQAKVHDIRILRGSRMEEDDYVEEHGVKTKYRVIPAAYGTYGGYKVLEYERCIRTTNTISEDEFKQLRLFHGLIYLLINVGFGAPLLKFCSKHYCHPMELLKTMAVVPNAEQYPELHKAIEKYNEQAAGEWFETKELADAYYMRDEIFDDLMKNGFPRLNTEFAANIVLNSQLKDELVAFLTESVRRGIPSEYHPVLEEISHFCASRIRSYSYLSMGSGKDAILSNGSELIVSQQSLETLAEFLEDFSEKDASGEMVIEFLDEKREMFQDKIRHYRGDTNLSQAIQALLHEDTKLVMRTAHVIKVEV